LAILIILQWIFKYSLKGKGWSFRNAATGTYLGVDQRNSVRMLTAETFWWTNSQKCDPGIAPIQYVFNVILKVII
jgi:hypothetical protein